MVDHLAVFDEKHLGGLVAYAEGLLDVVGKVASVLHDDGVERRVVRAFETDELALAAGRDRAGDGMFEKGDGLLLRSFQKSIEIGAVAEFLNLGHDGT